MAIDAYGARRIFDLEPLGPDVSPQTAGPLAQSGGQLVGAIVDGAVRTWLVHRSGLAAARHSTSLRRSRYSQPPRLATQAEGMTLERSLYDEVGGRAAVHAAVDLFYEKVWADPDLTSYFATVDRDKLKRHQRAFLGMALGGPDAYAGEKMEHAHSGLGITHDAFDRVVAHLVSTLEELRVPIDVIHQIGVKLTPLRRDIVDAGPAPA